MPDREVDVLIVGAGIAGLLLARELRLRRCRVVVVHDPAHPGASEAAVGLLNPVRGRRCTLAWQAADVFPTAFDIYRSLGMELETSLIHSRPVLRMFDQLEELRAFERRAPAIEAAGFRWMESPLPPGLRASAHGAVAIDGGGVVNTRLAVSALRGALSAEGAIIAGDTRALQLESDGPRLRWTHLGLTAHRVVMATGAGQIALHGPAHVSGLRPVQGEALLVHAPGLADGHAYVRGHHLAPLGGDLWACGGTKRPGNASDVPTAGGRTELEAFLHDCLSVPWAVREHWAGVRAATLDTLPVAGRISDDPRFHVFNGFGSQGFALGPWMARRMAAHLLEGDALPPGVDPRRFELPSDNAGPTHWHAVDVSHSIVHRHLAPGDLAIDLTAGNGGDTLCLGQAVGPDGAVLALDIQPEAVTAARRRLDDAGCESPISLHCADHARLAALVPPAWSGAVGAIIANLGYLPGSDSPVITRPESTIAALEAGLPLLRAGGVLVVVVYTQHAGGPEELVALRRWVETLDPSRFESSWACAPAHAARAPMVLSVVRLG